MLSKFLERSFCLIFPLLVFLIVIFWMLPILEASIKLKSKGSLFLIKHFFNTPLGNVSISGLSLYTISYTQEYFQLPGNLIAIYLNYEEAEQIGGNGETV